MTCPLMPPHISTTQRFIDVNAEQLSAAVELL
jgi:hypothetical protein